MKHTMLLVLAVVALSTALAAGALAATPKKGALYEGTLYASGTAALTKQVRIKVTPTGKTARVTWFCGAGRAQSTLTFAIKPDGTFKAFSNTGSLTVWSFVGRFVSATRARAVLHLNAICDGKGGTLNLNAKV
jgi:hypothetical protein